MDARTEATGDTVVVPGIEAPSSTACLRSLGKRGVRMVVVSEDEDTPAFHSKYCDESVLAPDPNEDLSGYEDLLLDLASRSSVRTIIPVREADVYCLARSKAEFSECIATPWPDFDQLEKVQDRKQLFDIAESVSVGVPETKLLTDWERWDRETIVKSRYTILVSDDTTSYPSVRYMEPGAVPETEKIIEEMGHVPLVQEYMADPDEYGFFALFDQGEPVATFQHRQIRGYKYFGGASAFRESVRIPALGEAGIRLLSELDWHGLAMVEFKRQDGEFKLMEINPRFWSSLPFSVEAGADFPYYYYQLATGQQSTGDDAYDVGIASHLVRGEIGYLYSIFSHNSPLAEKPSSSAALATVLRSLLVHPRFDYLDRDDPGPFVQDMRRTLKNGLSRRLKPNE